MKPGAGQGSPLRVAPPVQKILRRTLFLVWGRCRSSRLPYHHLCLRGLGGSWHGRAPRRDVVLAVDGPAEIKRAARLSTSSSARLDRWGSGGGGGGWGGGAGGAVVVVLQLQFIDKVVFVLLQLKFQQSRVFTGNSSTECWTFQLCSERGTHSANCAEGCSCVDVPVVSSDKFPQSRGSNPLAPDSAHPQSGEHSCCATDFRRDSTGAVLGVGQLLTCPYVYNDRCSLLAEFPHFLRESGL